MKLLVHVLFLMTALECFSFEDLLFKPLEANQIEARIGMIYQPNVDKLRMDIGNSFDLMSISDSDDLKIRAGGDFMTFTRLRSVGKFKFPVETTDYYFGINLSSLIKLYQREYQIRLRIAHISSHLIDGFTKDWDFLKEPYVYSREFIDVVLATKVWDDLRLYIGTNFLFSTIPKDFSLLDLQVGFDHSYFLNDLFDLEYGYDFRLRTINGVQFGQNSFQSGIKFKSYKRIGLFFGYYYYSGPSIHGLFYKDHDQYHGLGIQVKYK